MVGQVAPKRAPLTTLKEIRARFYSPDVTVPEAIGLLHACNQLDFPYKSGGERLHELFHFLREIAAERDDSYEPMEVRREARVVMARRVVWSMAGLSFTDSPALVKQVIDFYAEHRCHSQIGDDGNIGKFLEECWRTCTPLTMDQTDTWFERVGLLFLPFLKALAKVGAVKVIEEHRILGVIPDLYEEAVLVVEGAGFKFHKLPERLAWDGWRQYLGTRKFCSPIHLGKFDSGNLRASLSTNTAIIDQDVQMILCAVGQLLHRRPDFVMKPAKLEEKFQLLLSLVASFELMRRDWKSEA